MCVCLCISDFAHLIRSQLLIYSQKLIQPLILTVLTKSMLFDYLNHSKLTLKALISYQCTELSPRIYPTNNEQNSEYQGN